MNAEPSSFSLDLSPTTPQYPVAVSSLPASHVFSGLTPNTTYNIMATVNDNCGSIPSNEMFVTTLSGIGEHRMSCLKEPVLSLGRNE